MWPEIYQELFRGPDNQLARFVALYGIESHSVGRVAALVCFAVGWARYVKEWRTKRKYLNEDTPGFEFLRTKINKMPFSYQALFNDVDNDTNHLSLEKVPGKLSFLPYEYVHRDNYRLGSCEWTYMDPEGTSIIIPTKNLSDLRGKESIEFEIFEKAMLVCGKFIKRHLDKMFIHAEVIELDDKEVMFEIGDPDDNLFMIVEGEIKVVAIDPKTRLTKMLRRAKKGDRVHSLFSILDVLTGHSTPLKTVEAYSVGKSRVLKFPVSVIKDFLNLNPELLVGVVFRLIRRIYGLMFLILHEKLGLGSTMVSLFHVPDHLRQDPPVKELPYPIPAPSMFEEIPEHIRKDAIESLMRFFHVKESIYFDDCPIFIYDPDKRPLDYIVRDPLEIDCGLYKFKFMFYGEAHVFRYKNIGPYMERAPAPLKSKMSHEKLFRMQSGEGVGGITTFAVRENFLFLQIVKRSVLVGLDEKVIFRLLTACPSAILPIANQAVIRLAPIVRQIDFGMEWANVNGGETLYLSGDTVSDVYLVLSGRFRSFMSNARGASFHAEYDVGEWIGLIEGVTKFPYRSKSVVAARRSEVGKLSTEFIHFIKGTYYHASFNMLGVMIQRVEKVRLHGTSARKPTRKEQHEYDTLTSTTRRLTSISFIPIANNTPFVPFAKEVKKFYEPHGNVALVSWLTIQERFKTEEVEECHKYLLESWIARLLEETELIIFVLHPTNMYWNNLCLHNSEVAITLALQNYPVNETHLERYVGRNFNSIRREMIVFHKINAKNPTGFNPPSNTIAWLDTRPWIHMHHHIRLPPQAFDYVGLQPESVVDANYHGLWEQPYNMNSDMARYTRWLLGKSVGIVFTGGGARMAAQMGVLKAFVEQNIPIDLVGGVGTGGIVAAFYCLYEDAKKTCDLVKDFYDEIGNVLSSNIDFTIPFISPGQGRSFIMICEKYFCMMRIEDTFIPFFGVTCDISKQNARIHRDGPFWVFCRATLSNFINCPPMCDPRDGGYICDGSYANPIPEDIMRDFGAEYVLVINTAVGKTYEAPRIDTSKDIITNIWRVFITLASKLNFVTPDFVRVNDLLGRTQKQMYAEAVEANSDGLFVAFIKPPTEHYSSQLFENFKRLYLIGYKYTKGILKHCPIPNGEYHEFWIALKRSSASTEANNGRGLRNNVNDEFWNTVHGRPFDREERVERMMSKNERGIQDRLGKDYHGRALPDELLKEEVEYESSKNEFKEWVFNHYLDQNGYYDVLRPPHEAL